MPVYVTFKPEDGRRLPCRDGEDRTEYVERETGLRLRVTRQGARAWAIAYYAAEVRAARRLKLGDGARMPASEARKAARAALAAVEREGRDPAAERAAQGAKEREARQRRAAERLAARERARKRVTFATVARAYVEHRRTTRSGHRQPARPNTLSNWRGMLDNHILPALGQRAVESITVDDFRDVLEAAVRGGPSMGPRVRELLSAIWRWLETRPRELRGVTLPPVSPLVGLPNDIGHAEKARATTLSPAEIWKLWRATEHEGRDGLALRLMLLTAARVREVTNVERAELDLGAAKWNLPAARCKGGRDRTIPLSPQAIALFRDALSLAPDRPLAGESLDDTMARLRAAMGVPWQARDLRRTAATLCARLGADPFVVALVLGHANPDQRMPGVTAGYLRWDYADKVKDALTRLGQWIEETVNRKTEPGDVVKIRARA